MLDFIWFLFLVYFASIIFEFIVLCDIYFNLKVLFDCRWFLRFGQIRAYSEIMSLSKFYKFDELCCGNRVRWICEIWINKSFLNRPGSGRNVKTADNHLSGHSKPMPSSPHVRHTATASHSSSKVLLLANTQSINQSILLNLTW